MINRNIMQSAVAATISISSIVFAGQPDSLYGGIQYTAFDYNEDGISGNFKPTGLIGRLGKTFNENVSVEGRFGTGVSEGTNPVFGIEGTLDFDTIIGVYGIGQITLSKSSSAYALIGYTRVDATVTVPTLLPTESVDESGLSLGVGADIGLSNNVSLNIEYVQYLSKSDFDLDAFALGVKFGF